MNNYKFLEFWHWPKDYYGEDYSDYYIVHSISHDSSLLGNHNHAVIWNRLEKVNVNNDDDEIEYLIKPSFRYWAVGWIEIIMVHKYSSAELLKEVNNLLYSLDIYPILDEDLYSDKLYQECEEYWKGLSLRERIQMCNENDVNFFAVRRDYPPEELDEILEMIVES